MWTIHRVVQDSNESPLRDFVLSTGQCGESETRDMPIKFRCDKCRQFLGISRSLAGRIVDCPTCGRSTRVPELDGSRKPIPKQPKLPTGDSSLLNALDQLADLGKAPAEEEAAAAQSTATPSEPIVLEPVKAATVIDPPAAPAQPGSKKKSPAVATPVDPGVLEELASAEPIVLEPAVVRRPSWVPVFLTATIVGFAAFAAGWFLRNSRPTDVPADAPTGTDSEPTVQSHPRAGVHGRITYRRTESTCLPDRGSRIIAWPVGFEPDPLWQADGFRPGDADTTTEPARASLEQAGGAMAIADDSGHFEIKLPSGGDYEILILSRFGGQGFDEVGLTAAESARLGPCFAEPKRLIGKTQFRLLRIKYRGEGEHLLDHVFEVID